jgi:rhomboid protease GluP
MSDGTDHDVKRCGKCAAWIPTSATMCAYCGTSEPDAPPARATGPALSLRHGFSVTNALILANAVYFAFSLFVQWRATPDGNPLQWALTGTGLDQGLDYPGAYKHADVVERHEWWRVLCATFLHFGGIHILMNMLALKQLGALAESLFGPAKFLTVYVVSGACSALAVSVWYAGVEHRPANDIPGLVGASGAIFGVAGLLIAYLMRAGTERGRAIGFAIGKNILFMLAVGLVVPFISQVGHVGGLLPGLLFGMTLRGEFTARARPATRSAWPRAALLCAAAIVVSLLAGAWHAHLSLVGGH